MRTTWKREAVILPKYFVRSGRHCGLCEKAMRSGVGPGGSVAFSSGESGWKCSPTRCWSEAMQQIPPSLVDLPFLSCRLGGFVSSEAIARIKWICRVPEMH